MSVATYRRAKGAVAVVWVISVAGLLVLLGWGIFVPAESFADFIRWLETVVKTFYIGTVLSLCAAGGWIALDAAQQRAGRGRAPVAEADPLASELAEHA